MAGPFDFEAAGKGVEAGHVEPADQINDAKSKIRKDGTTLYLANHAKSSSHGTFKTVLLITPTGEKTFTVDDLEQFDRDNDPDNMMGKRWLCRGDSLLLAGPTGIGKSSFIMQAMVRWSLGLDLFGIKPVKPLKCLIIQAENNKGDLAIAFQDIRAAMKLSKDEVAILQNHLIFKQVTSIVGRSFAAYARNQIIGLKPDIIIVDPFLSYLGGDINQAKDVTPFLREQIQPILNETGVIWIFIHHTGKPPRENGGTKATGRRTLYDTLGSSDMLNWAREIISIKEHDWDTRTFKLEFGKRARQANITDENGSRVFQLLLKHSSSGVVWELADQAQRSDQTDYRAKVYEEKVLKIRHFIIEHEEVNLDELKEFASQNGIARNDVGSMARALSVKEGATPRIWHRKIQGTTNKRTVFTILPEPEPPEQEVKTKTALKHARRKRKNSP